MFKVIRSELMKYFSGSMIYICTAITILLSVLNYTATKLVVMFNPEQLPELAKTFENMSTQKYILNSLLSLFSGGGVFIIITIVAATLISEDYGRGTMKYSLLATTKEKLILGKIFTAGIIYLIFIAASLISSIAIGVYAFEWDASGQSILQIAGAYNLGWLTLFGFSCMIMFAVNRISKISGAIGLGIGIYMTIGVMGVIVPETIKPLIITANFDKVMDMSLSTWSELFLINGMYILIFSVLSVILFRKKEVLY